MRRVVAHELNTTQRDRLVTGVHDPDGGGSASPTRTRNVPVAASARGATFRTRPQCPDIGACCEHHLDQRLPGRLVCAGGQQDASGDALRSDLAGIAFREPGTDTQVRLYGFAKLTGSYDHGPRSQPTRRCHRACRGPAARRAGGAAMS